MDTIKSTIASASKYVYGDDASNQSGQEPISGQQGKGTADEPFDAGNQEGESDRPPLLAALGVQGCAWP